MQKFETAQQVFDHVYGALKKQGRRSVRADNPYFCYYRALNGDKCAAGHLIADEYYDPAFEDYDTLNPGVREALIKSGVSKEHLELVRSLQKAHDEFAPFYESEPFNATLQRLCVVAKGFGLTVPQ